MPSFIGVLGHELVPSCDVHAPLEFRFSEMQVQLPHPSQDVSALTHSRDSTRLEIVITSNNPNMIAFDHEDTDWLVRVG